MLFSRSRNLSHSETKMIVCEKNHKSNRRISPTGPPHNAFGGGGGGGGGFNKEHFLYRKHELS